MLFGYLDTWISFLATTTLLLYTAHTTSILCIPSFDQLRPYSSWAIHPSSFFLPMTPCATETGMSFFSLKARRFLSKSSRHNALWPRIKTRPIYTMQSSLAIIHTIPSKAFLTSCQFSQHSFRVCPKTVRFRSQFIVGRGHIPVSRSSPTWNQRMFYSLRFGSLLMGFLLREYFTVYALWWSDWADFFQGQYLWTENYLATDYG